MDIPIETVRQLGKLVGAVRKSQKLDQESAGAFSGNSINTVSNFEKGSGAMSIERVFSLMDALGLKVTVEVALPESDSIARAKLQAKLEQLVGNNE